MGFFQNLFGKKTCTLCGAECGVMHRTKIKGGEFVCSDCVRKCSAYVRLSEMDKAEIENHIAYMERQEKLYQEKFSKAKVETFPTGVTKQGIQFADELGMFTIVDRTNAAANKVNHEMFRYDQVAGWEAYEEYDQPSEPGKPKVFKERGIKIRLVGPTERIDSNSDMGKKGLRPHPYVKREIKLVFNTKESDTDYTDNAVAHFNFIFGVHDSEKGLFSFGMSKQEKRDLKGAVAFAKTAAAAMKAAKEGEGSLTDEKKAEIEQNMHDMEDAQTGGLAEYTRRANAAEESI